jgi:hypothetical protein
MKRTLTILAVAITLPIAAEETAKPKAAETAKPQAAAASTDGTIGSTPAAQDSPLVAAARRTNRRGKKPSNVITNQTLARSGDAKHVTTTTNQGTLHLPAPAPPLSPTPEMVAAQKAAEQRKKAEAEAEKKKAEEAKRQEQAARAANRTEDDVFDENDADGSQGERELEAEKKPPQF